MNEQKLSVHTQYINQPQKGRLKLDMVAYTFNPSTLEADLCDFKARMIYRVSSRTVRAMQRNPVLKNNQRLEDVAQGLDR